MKLQNVILRAMAKKITWADAAEIAGVSPLAMSWIRHRYETFGYDGLFEQKGRKRIMHRVPLQTAEKVFDLYQTLYADADLHCFRFKLQTEHGIEVNQSWLQLALEGAGLVARPIRTRTLRPRPVSVYHRIVSGGLR